MSARQQGPTLNLVSEDGGALEIQIAEPTASLMVRDNNQQLEYAD